MWQTYTWICSLHGNRLNNSLCKHIFFSNMVFFLKLRGFMLFIGLGIVLKVSDCIFFSLQEKSLPKNWNSIFYFLIERNPWSFSLFQPYYVFFSIFRKVSANPIQIQLTKTSIVLSAHRILPDSFSRNFSSSPDFSVIYSVFFLLLLLMLLHLLNICWCCFSVSKHKQTFYLVQ